MSASPKPPPTSQTSIHLVSPTAWVSHPSQKISSQQISPLKEATSALAKAAASNQNAIRFDLTVGGLKSDDGTPAGLHPALYIDPEKLNPFFRKVYEKLAWALEKFSLNSRKNDDLLYVINKADEMFNALAYKPEKVSSPYLPSQGDLNYCQAIEQLVLGSNHDVREHRHITTAQTVGGTGALNLAAQFLHKHLSLLDSNQKPLVYVPNSTWDNHKNIFNHINFNIKTYSYINENNGTLNFDDLKESLNQIPEGSVVVLHASCHNPTGQDLSPDQWRQISTMLGDKKLIPVFDNAYQGLAQGINEDALGIQTIVKNKNIPRVLIASSNSKNFMSYGDRIGSLIIITPSNENYEAELQRIISATYKNGVTNPAKKIAYVLNNPKKFAQWQKAIQEYRELLNTRRASLKASLNEILPDVDWNNMLGKHGMFCVLRGLSKEFFDELRNQHGIYMPKDGRVPLGNLDETSFAAFTTALRELLPTYKENITNNPKHPQPKPEKQQ